MDPINPLSSSIQPISPANPQTRERGQGQQPNSGQLLKATVVETTGENRFVLDFSGSKQTVRSEAALATGQTLQLQVTKTSPAIELRIVTDTLNAFLGRSLTLLDSNLDLTTLYKTLQQPVNLTKITPTSQTFLENYFSAQQHGVGEKDSGTTLKHLIDSLGLNLENMLVKGESSRALGTLKATLLEIANSFRNAESIAQSTTKILTVIELFQFAQLNSSSNSLYIFPLPLPFLEHGYLVIDKREQKDRDDPDQVESHFSLHLTMTDIGNLCIEFLKNHEGIFVKFQAETEELAQFIGTYTDEFKQAISGVNLVSVTFSGGAPDPRLDLVHYLVPEGKSMLDTTV